MLERFFTYGHVLERLRSGALGTILDEMAGYLDERGQSPRVAQAYLNAAGHFYHWLEIEKILPSAVSEATLAAFVDDHLPRCRCRIPRGSGCHLRAALSHVLAVLRARGWAAPLQLPAGTAKLLRDWLVRVKRDPDAPVFPNRAGQALSRSGVEQRLRVAVADAQQRCPSLRGRCVSPHTLRHTTAMHLLQSGVDLTVIALWLGHESPETTHRYIEADLRMKERALGLLQEPPARNLRYRAGDRLLAFLDGL